MRDSFEHFYEPSVEEFKNLWQDCYFSFDTNVLLNVYRFTESTREDFFTVLEKLKERIWIPHQVAWEYHRNRLNTIFESTAPYEELRRLANLSQQDFSKEVGKLNLQGKRPHPYIKIDEILTIVNKGYDDALSKLAEMEKLHPDLRYDDSLRERLTNLFDGKVGKPYPLDQLPDLYSKIKLRYEREVPPGYGNISSKNVPEDYETYAKAYGDAILWFQLMDFAKQTKKPIVFVTSEIKEDWWYKFHGQTIGPRRELIKEMLINAQVRFYMYEATRFVDFAGTYFELELKEDTVDEIRDVSSQTGKEEYYQNLREKWPLLRESISQIDRYIPALLASCKPIYFDGEKLVLGFDYPILKEKFDKKPSATHSVSEAVHKVLGLQNVQVLTVVNSRWKGIEALEEELAIHEFHSSFPPEPPLYSQETEDIPF